MPVVSSQLPGGIPPPLPQSGRESNHAPLGCSAECAPPGEVGGGGLDSAALPNSRTGDLSEVGDAALESSQWVLFKQFLKKFF